MGGGKQWTWWKKKYRNNQPGEAEKKERNQNNETKEKRTRRATAAAVAAKVHNRLCLVAFLSLLSTDQSFSSSRKLRSHQTPLNDGVYQVFLIIIRFFLASLPFVAEVSRIIDDERTGVYGNDWPNFFLARSYSILLVLFTFWSTN